jgi:hypothetical protein
MRAVLAPCLLLAVLVLAGCGGAEDATQRLARHETESYLANDPRYDVDEIHCTGNPRPWFVERQASLVICAARRIEGGCDWYRVELVPVGASIAARIELEAENAGCVLPV